MSITFGTGENPPRRPYSTVHLRKSEPMVEALRLASFPGYTGQKFKMEFREQIRFADTQWSGGSRSEYIIIKLDGMQRAAIPEAPFMERSQVHEMVYPIPPGYVVVKHSWFCGQDMGLTFYVHPSTVEMTALAAGGDATRNERIVLAATGRKSSYGGIKDYRYYEAHHSTGITRAEYDAAKESCIQKGWLNRAGAITVEGRNVRGRDDLWDFRLGRKD